MPLPISANDPDVRPGAIDHDVHRLPCVGDLRTIRRYLWIGSDLELKYVGIQEPVAVEMVISRR
jgi:hypothetical protein